MKQLLNHLTDGARPLPHCAGPMTRPAVALALLGAVALACSDEEGPSNPAVTTQPAAPQGQVTRPAAGGEAAPGSEGMPMGTDAPPGDEGARPVGIAEPGAASGMEGSGAGMSGGAGGAPSMMAAGGAPAMGSGGMAGAPAVAGSGGAPNDGWVPLFNGMNLDGWVLHGTTQPLFAVENGEMHVYPTQADQSNQPQANLRNTTRLGGKYTLHVEYRWGEARFSDRRQTARDAGILFHITGDVTRVWPDSIECQIGSSPINGNAMARTGSDWVSGDLWVIGTPTTAQTANANGQLQTRGGGFGFASASSQAENALGEWNTIEVSVDGAAQAIYTVNGVEVNRVFNMAYNGQPLSEGFISVQAEYAELFYRNIRYRVDE